MTVKVFFAYVRSKQRIKVTVGPLKSQRGKIMMIYVTDNLLYKCYIYNVSSVIYNI